MPHVKGYAAHQAKEPLKPFSFERREPGANEVLIDIHFCGVCHSDLHQVRNEWGGASYPMVPGHEIVGKVEKAGPSVRKFKPGDSVGVGCFVDSCRTCSSCREGLEQYCEAGAPRWTYGSYEADGKTPTYGGYSTKITVNADYVLRVPPKIPLHQAAPLLCAGITTYSPLHTWNAGPGKKVGVLGLGGLGHMAVKIGAAMGAEVTVLSSSDKKKDDAKRLGASGYINTSQPDAFSKTANTLDLIINTVSAPNSLDADLGLLKRDGTMVLVGAPEKPGAVNAFTLIGKRRRLAGSLIGGIRETQEMLDFCAEKGFGADVEVIPMDKINEAYERMLKSDVRYRFVIDLASLKA
jgi:alcohol dehydrogenase (NADP+)